MALSDRLAASDDIPPPIHFVSGAPTTLGELAAMAIRIAKSGSTVRTAAPRDFDVARFFGCGARASELLGWQPRVGLEEGLTRLIVAFGESRQSGRVGRQSET